MTVAGWLTRLPGCGRRWPSRGRYVVIDPNGEFRVVWIHPFRQRVAEPASASKRDAPPRSVGGDTPWK
jgi:hypothetical protein